MRNLSFVFALAASAVFVGAIPSPVPEDFTTDSSAADAATTDAAAASTCRSPEVRKEWRAFTSMEKAAYINAVKCLAKKPHTSALVPQYPRSNLPNVTTDSSYYDDMTYVHMDLTDQIHYTGYFLPWHRQVSGSFGSPWYINQHVTQLKVRCKYTGVMPYWDWSIDAGSFSLSSIFSTDPITGLGGFGDPTKDYTVTTGGFATMTVAYPIKHKIRRKFTLFPYLDWFWLQRPTEAATTTLVKSFVNQAINGYVGDFIGFQNATEKAQSFHPNIHMIMGGDMAGTCPTAAGASCTGGSTWTPNDPLFFLHHANIDRIWYLWQRKNAANANAFAGGSVSTYTDPAYPNGYPPWLSKSSLLPTDGMFPQKTIKSMLSTTGGDLCYVYQ